MKTFSTLLKTELKLSIRGLDMVIFALFMPIVVLIILGCIYGSKPAFEGANYSFLSQSFSAVVMIAISAGGLMGLPLVISDYREKKILKKYKVTPVSPVMLLTVQFCIYAIYSLVSLISLYVLGKLFFNLEINGSIFFFLLGYFLVMFSIFSIGLMVGGVAKDSKQAGAIASLLYFPMIIFSGTTLPYEVMPKMMQNVVDILPLTQGIKVLKSVVIGENINNIIIPSAVMIIIFIICCSISIKKFKWE